MAVFPGTQCGSLAADNLLSGVRGDVHRFFRIAAAAVAQNIQKRAAPARTWAHSLHRSGGGAPWARSPIEKTPGPARVRSTEKSEGTMSGESLLVIFRAGFIWLWLAGPIGRG